MLTLIAEIDEFKGSWRTLGTLAPEKLAALRKVATIESIGSSTRIEGCMSNKLNIFYANALQNSHWTNIF